MKAKQKVRNQLNSIFLGSFVKSIIQNKENFIIPKTSGMNIQKGKWSKHQNLKHLQFSWSTKIFNKLKAR